MATVIFVHAHPDDEAIFTGGTMRRLADRGHQVVLAVATGGELGVLSGDALQRHQPTDAGELAALRRAETASAARLLGVSEVVELGFADSGMAGDPANDVPGSLWSTGADEGARRLLEALADLWPGGPAEPPAFVGYDAFGIYGHPDHVRVHELTHLAAARLGIDTVYDATVDREHLHFVETHLVEEALLAGDLGLVRSRLGVPSVEVTTTVEVHDVLPAKRAAMSAHASQIPETTSAMLLPEHHFAAVYGLEWYVRHGRPGPLDDL